jgi:DUF4097 and DUF4098 domain-containing protein YvlB
MGFLDDFKDMLFSGDNDNIQIVSGNGNIVSRHNININGSSVIQINGKKIVIDGVELDHDIDITINGPIDHDITIPMAKHVTLNGNVKDLHASQGNIEVHGDVSGDAKSSQGDVDIDGNVSGDAKSSQGNVRIGGSVSGSAKSSQGNVRIGK